MKIIDQNGPAGKSPGRVPVKLQDKPLPAEFWDNITASRRRRLRRRAWRRGFVIGLLAGLGGYLMVTGLMTSDLERLFYGVVLGFFLLGYVLVITSTPPKYEWKF